ncbi:hypothetical protein TMatcc_001704 [Talaromyces marneffei ATCC 18224]|nr:uncharacterized protein EYB26_007092 [Talaromyces marneffei]KAE8551724.1 hypothetical protein EYB25_005614 [Talaromyces marneffei]QGA19403.1 hypothetical protein EYB26_007092 [Talaromyces marneffei]
MTQREQAASNSAISSNTSESTTTSNILQTADNVLNTVGDKVADVTGQHQAVQTTIAFVQENVLRINEQQTNGSGEEKYDVEAVYGFGAAKEHVDNAGDEKIEEFLRHQNRSYQG